MKIIKEGKPYRKHKCSKCKTIYVYHINEDKFLFSDFIRCPLCNNYLVVNMFDKKISKSEYEKIGKKVSNE